MQLSRCCASCPAAPCNISESLTNWEECSGSNIHKLSSSLLICKSSCVIQAKTGMSLYQQIAKQLTAYKLADACKYLRFGIEWSLYGFLYFGSSGQQTHLTLPKLAIVAFSYHAFPCCRAHLLVQNSYLVASYALAHHISQWTPLHLNCASSCHRHLKSIMKFCHARIRQKQNAAFRLLDSG